jgi:hypothetical protein
MHEVWPIIVEYISSRSALVAEVAVSPYICELWPAQELDLNNEEYDVERLAPGFRGFATSGGGEMFALSPTGSIVCLPFIGMAPSASIELAPSWAAFTSMLSSAA